MKALMIIALLSVGTVYAQDDSPAGEVNEVNQFMATNSTNSENGKKECADKKGHLKVLDTVYEWKEGGNSKVRVYFGDSIDKGKGRVKDVMLEAQKKGLVFKSAQGSASFKPWGDGDCTGPAVHFYSAKLKECNNKLALQRAYNAVDVAKGVFNFDASQEKRSKAISRGAAQFTQGCAFYDETVDAYPGKSSTPKPGVSDPYLKYQYVDLFFAPKPPCFPESKIIKGENISSTLKGMAGRKCKGKDTICANSTGQLHTLEDETQCTEYFRLSNSITMKMEAYWVPDYFNFVEINKVTCSKVSDNKIGYISRLSGSGGDAEFKKWYLDKQPGVDTELVSFLVENYVFLCKEKPGSDYKCITESSVISVSVAGIRQTGYTNTCYSPNHKDYRRPPANCVSLKDNLDLMRFTFPLKYKSKLITESAIENLNQANIIFNPKYRNNLGHQHLSYGQSSYYPPGNDNFRLFRAGERQSAATMGAIHSDFKKYYEANTSGFKDKVVNAFKMKLKQQLAKLKSTQKSSGLDPDFKGFDVGSFEEFKKLFEEVTGESWSNVKKSPNSIVLKPGDYCLQVKAPMNGTVWGYGK